MRVGHAVRKMIRARNWVNLAQAMNQPRRRLTRGLGEAVAQLAELSQPCRGHESADLGLTQDPGETDSSRPGLESADVWADSWPAQG